MYICGVRCDIFILVDKKYWPNEAQFSHLHRLAVSLFGDFEFLLSSNSTCSRLWLLVLMLKNTIIHRFYLTIWSPRLQDFSCWLIIVHTKSVFRLLDRRQKPVPIFFVFFYLFQSSSSVHFVLMDISVTVVYLKSLLLLQVS